MAKKKKSKAKTMPMRVLDKKRIPYEIRQQSSKQFTAEGVASDLGVNVAQVVKAMFIEFSEPPRGNPRSQYVLVVIPGNRRLSLKKVGATIGDKKVKLASGRDVERVTGYQLGAVSVIGFRKTDIPNYVDQGVLELGQVIISSGRPDLGLALSADDITRAMEGAHVGDYCTDG